MLRHQFMLLVAGSILSLLIGLSGGFCQVIEQKQQQQQQQQQRQQTSSAIGLGRKTPASLNLDEGQQVGEEDKWPDWNLASILSSTEFKNNYQNKTLFDFGYSKFAPLLDYARQHFIAMSVPRPADQLDKQTSLTDYHGPETPASSARSLAGPVVAPGAPSAPSTSPTSTKLATSTVKSATTSAGPMALNSMDPILVRDQFKSMLLEMMAANSGTAPGAGAAGLERPNSTVASTSSTGVSAKPAHFGKKHKDKKMKDHHVDDDNNDNDDDDDDDYYDFDEDDLLHALVGVSGRSLSGASSARGASPLDWVSDLIKRLMAALVHDSIEAETDKEAPPSEVEPAAKKESSSRKLFHHGSASRSAQTHHHDRQRHARGKRPLHDSTRSGDTNDQRDGGSPKRGLNKLLSDGMHLAGAASSPVRATRRAPSEGSMREQHPASDSSLKDLSKTLASIPKELNEPKLLNAPAKLVDNVLKTSISSMKSSTNQINSMANTLVNQGIGKGVGKLLPSALQGAVEGGLTKLGESAVQVAAEAASGEASSGQSDLIGGGGGGGVGGSRSDNDDDDDDDDDDVDESDYIDPEDEVVSGAGDNISRQAKGGKKRKYISKECRFRVACEMGRILSPMSPQFIKEANENKYLKDLQNKYTEAMTYGTNHDKCHRFYCVFVSMMGGPRPFAAGVMEIFLAINKQAG